MGSGLTIATSCPRCDGDIEIAFAETPAFDRMMAMSITCPYCGGVTGFETGRRILWVAPRFSDYDPDVVN